MARRRLHWIIALATALHLIGMARTPLPAQDGLKFIRFARAFQTQPWGNVVRASDQHPLYPATIALVQPAFAFVVGEGPDAWRIAAQAVSVIAALALLVPLYGLARELFGRRTASLAALLFVLLPLPAQVGHDTLSDSLAMLGFTTAFWLGAVTLRTDRLRPALGCGLASGLGYLARPEIAIVPVIVVLVALGRGIVRFCPRGQGPRTEPERSWHFLPFSGQIPAMLAVVLAIVGSYAIIKGNVSEKLALRYATSLGRGPELIRTAPHWLPTGLDDPRWDFAPKEADEQSRMSLVAAGLRFVRNLADGLGWIFLPLAVWGAWRVRLLRYAGGAKWMSAVFVTLFAAILIRHAAQLGYLSSRHILTVVIVALPWAAAGSRHLVRRLAHRRGWDKSQWKRFKFALLIVGVLGAIWNHYRDAHPSRWGYLAAGHWLAEHAKPGEAVLDTRGWAAFVSGLPSYDYWHVRQAFTDANLAFIVVDPAELDAPSRRAETLRAVLDFAASPAACFPKRRGEDQIGVRVYRFESPECWEGIVP